MQSEADILALLKNRFPNVAKSQAFQWYVARNGGFVTDIIEWGASAVICLNADGIKLRIDESGVREV